MDVTRNAPRFNAAFGFALVAGALALGVGVRAAALDVPVDQKITVALTAVVTSQTAHVGDPFEFATTEDLKFGALMLPKGTPGHGRLAAVTPAIGKARGQLALQADSLDLPDGNTIWVNIDPSKPPKGRLSDRHTKPILLPLPIGLGGGFTTTSSGNMVLDKGVTFVVVTIPPRAAPAPLVTATPTPEPTPSPTPKATTPPPTPRATVPPPTSRPTGM